VKQRQPRIPAAPPAEFPQRPALQPASRFLLLEREVEIQYRPRMLEAPQGKVHAVADSLRDWTPVCDRCGRPMQRHDTESVSWTARFGDLTGTVVRYRCRGCKTQRRPLRGLLGVTSQKPSAL
jgi:hypothetical protein